MSDIIFVNGLGARKPHENAPSFVIADLSVKVADLHEWLNTNQGLANDAGYINLSLKESKAGKFYIAVNDYKPKSETPSVKQPANDIDDSDVPFQEAKMSKLIKISEDHGIALENINDANFGFDNLNLVVEDMIEEYLNRERGRLGEIINGKYNDTPY